MPTSSFRDDSQELRVLIVDAHLSVAEMITVFLQRERRFQVVGEVTTTEEAFHIYRRYRPSLVISGLELGTMGGPGMLCQMRAENPEIQTLVYTGTTKLHLLYEALEMEPRGFVHKSESLVVLHQALVLVADGISYRSSYATTLLDRKRIEEQTACRLTAQEHSLVRLVAQGLSTKQIAAQLYFSPKTVENYRQHLMKKLGVTGIAGLTTYALRRGMLE